MGYVVYHSRARRRAVDMRRIMVPLLTISLLQFEAGVTRARRGPSSPTGRVAGNGGLWSSAPARGQGSAGEIQDTRQWHPANS